MYQGASTQYKGLMHTLRSATYGAALGLAALTLGCGETTYTGRVQGDLVTKLNTEPKDSAKGKYILTIKLTNPTEVAKVFGLNTPEIKVSIPKPVGEPYASQLEKECLEQTTFGRNECYGDFEAKGRRGQTEPYYVTKINRIDVKTPARQATEWVKKKGQALKEKAKELDEKYKIGERAKEAGEAIKEKAEELDKKYQIQQRAKETGKEIREKWRKFWEKKE